MKQTLQLIKPFREMRKMAFFSFLLIALIAIPTGMKGQSTYTKVTTAPSDWSGTYVIVADESSVIFTGQSGNNTYGGYAGVTISNNSVTGDFSAYEIEIEQSGNYYSMKHINSSKYLGWTSGNSLAFSTSAPTTNQYRWVLSTSSILNANDNSRKLQYNSGSPRFACYTSNQKVAYLYKKETGSTTTCATPTFSPAAGTYTQAQNVTISCTTEDVTIYYTTDGNAPTTSSTVYSAPINVSSNTTIKAMAAKSGYDNSSIATAEYAFITLDHAGTLADPYTVADAHTAIDANAGTQNVYATGIVSAIPTEYNSTYGNITFNMVDEEGDEVFLQAYRCGGDEAANVAVGDVAVVYGNLIKYGSTYEFGSGCTLVSLTHPVVTTPTVTVTPATINAPAEGADGTLALTYENIEEFTSFDYYFCDADGNALEGDAPNWIYAEINGENDAYTLSYIIDANDGAARTAYLKVYTFDDNLEEVFAIVTVNQEEFVAPTYAELPFEFNGGIADIESTDGLYQEGLGTDYSASTNPNTKLKFDGTGDWLLLQFNERPGTLTFDIKNNSFSGGTFKVQTSEDGVSYIDLETYTEISGTQNEEFTDLGENVRYIKWIYTNKVSGNVGLGNITLAEYVAPVPAITVASTTITAIAEQTTGTLGVTYTEIKTEAGVDVRWFESDGTTPASQPDWMIITDITFSNIDYLIYANDGVARTAYFKLYGLDVDLNDVYSELVTVTQAAAPQQYTLTVNASENVEIFTFVGETSEQGVEGSTTLQVTEGTTVGLSVSAASGYILESIVVDGVDVISQLDESGLYQFTMPTHNVAVTATAVEYVPFEPATYTLATSIESGQTYIIVGQYGGDYAMGTQNSNNRKAEEIIIDETTATVSTEDVYEFTISALEDESGFYSIYDGRTSGYLYAASSSANHLKTKDELDVNGKWEIIFNAETGAASIVATNSSNRNVMQYNSGSHLFSCYASASQYPVYLYVKEGIPVTEPHIVYFFPGTGTCVVDTMYRGGAFTLPDASTTCDGWEFVGWSSQAVNETTSAPEGLLTETFTATEATTLYAVYSDGDTYSSFPVTSPITLPYFNDFETSAPDYVVGSYGNGRTYVKPEGWTIVSQTPPTTRRARPQVFYTASYAHSGSYSLRLDSAAVTAMPRLSDDIDVSKLKMEFYVRQPNTGQYLEVGVMTDLADPGSFVSVATIDNSTSAVTHWYVDFGGYENNSADHHYIAFRNSGATNRSINNIDDISLYKENPCELSLSALPYTETFDSITEITSPVRTGVEPECWVVAHQYELLAPTTKPQVFYTPSYANSGNYSLRMEGRCIYAMPKLAEDVDVRALHMELYLRQPNASQQLEVGVMSNLNDEGTFVSVATISNNGAGVEYKLIDFSGYSGTGKYIAFRNSVVGGGTGKSINNIDDISLYVENPCEVSLSDLPYTETFDNVTEITSTDRTGEQPECWVVAHQYELLTPTTKPQVFYTPSYANSGNYSLRMEGRCIYAMPKLAEDVDVRALHMELYLRQPNASQQLEVGVMSNLNDEGTFVSVATISNNGTGVEYKLIDFSGYSGTGKYIAFRNSVVGGGTGKSINNIDDISLYVENPCEVSLDDLPYTETFDNVTEITSTDRTGEQPECWTVAHRYTQLTNTTKPQVFYTSSYAHSGSYSLRMEGQCIYAMPKLAEDIDVSMLQMELYVRQPYADQQLEVGVMSNLNDPTTFQTVLTINTTPRVVEQVVLDFSEYSGAGKYIAFRNSVVGGGTGKSINNIDDITLSLAEAKIAEMSSENEIDAMDVERYLEDIKVYPNPTRGNLYIDAMDVQKVECYNQMGQLVGVYDNANELNIGDLSNGIYMLRITVPQGVTMRKVVKR